MHTVGESFPPLSTGTLRVPASKAPMAGHTAVLFGPGRALFVSPRLAPIPSRLWPVSPSPAGDVENASPPVVSDLGEPVPHANARVLAHRDDLLAVWRKMGLSNLVGVGKSDRERRRGVGEPPHLNRAGAS
eukprot:scaffold14098_cov129-Isochrysis_galbana.AAC.9